MSEKHHGITREEQVRDIAAHLGVADFVYLAPPVRKGAALREASGDGLLVVGTRGAVLQVKARDPLKARNDSEKRALAWVLKNAHKARKQGLGTKRELARRQSSGSPMIVFPVRAARLERETRQRYLYSISQDVRKWPVIIVIDHPQAPEVDLGFIPGVVTFTFEDWREIQLRLRSTSAMIEYVTRALQNKHHVPLGREGERYAAMRAADEALAAASSSSMQPYLAHTEHYDKLGTDIFHDVINKIWPDDGIIPWKSAEEYRTIVEFLDAVPPQTQSIVGRWLLHKRREIANGQHTASGLSRIDLRDRLVYACSHFHRWSSTEEWLIEVRDLTSLRHSQALQTGAPDETTTLGVGVLVEERGGQSAVSYSFLMFKGREAEVEMPEDIRRYYEWSYGVHNHRAGETRELIVRRNEPCPCGSGKKYKKCHGR